ncbi:hypothetical protein R1sor_005202 [Riccia sorocarpa]|uniref:Uncharacterized protein n=1 Tax=Riccia sorocarpa TaxID=122646 RepID=A0ABD3HL42_9MARC
MCSHEAHVDLSLRSASSEEVHLDRSDESEGTEPNRGNSKEGRGAGRGRRGKKVANVITPSVRIRSQCKKDPQIGTDTMSTNSGGDSRRSLWKEEKGEERDSRSACASIIDKYRMDFGGKQPPRIPLCRLEPFTRVRKLQLSSGHAEDLKRSFRLNGYMESCHGFHVSPVDESGNEVVLTSEEEDSWDFFWKTASQDFDRECRTDPDFDCLAGKKFKVWDGNHRLTVWLQVSSEEKFRKSLIHHPRVRCVVVKPPPDALKEMEVAMHNLNITSHATVQYDWIQDVERTFQVLSTPLLEYKPLLGDKVYNELEESRKKTTTRGWYSDNMTITVGAYIMSYSEEKGKRDVKVEVGIDRIKAFAAAHVPPDLKVKLLKLHYSNDANARSIYHHPPGNDVDSEIRPWLHQWGMWALIESHCLEMLTACVGLQPAESTTKVQAEEEDKFFIHVEEYRNKFWKEVWNSGAQDRMVDNIGRRAKRFFFRYVVWVRMFEVLPACFVYWQQPLSDTFSMFSDEDSQCRKFYELGDWERANCPFYVDFIEDPPKMFDEMEQLCYDRRLDAARAQIAMEEAASQPDLASSLHDAYVIAIDKLPQVFDPRRLQALSSDEALEQCKQYEPNADKIQSVFGKVKQRKQVPEEPPPKTPAKPIETNQEGTGGMCLNQHQATCSACPFVVIRIDGIVSDPRCLSFHLRCRRYMY